MTTATKIYALTSAYGPSLEVRCKPYKDNQMDCEVYEIKNGLSNMYLGLFTIRMYSLRKQVLSAAIKKFSPAFDHLQGAV